MTDDNPNIMLMLGRLEGKVDAFMALQKAHSTRLDDLETRLSEAEREITALEASRTNSAGWLTHLAAYAALAIAIGGQWLPK